MTPPRPDVGTWRLVCYVAEDGRGGGLTYPLERDAVGLIELVITVAVVFRCWAYDKVVVTGSADRVVLLRETERNRIESR